MAEFIFIYGVGCRIKFCLSGVRCRKKIESDILIRDDSYGENIPEDEHIGNHLDSGSKCLVNILK